MSSDDDLTFASSGVAGVHYAKCWPCMLGQCPGGWHGWADPVDIAHAKVTGQPDPSDKRCACECTQRDPDPYPEPPPDMDEQLNATPCAMCGESRACGYDAEGRPLIHASGDEDEA